LRHRPPPGAHSREIVTGAISVLEPEDTGQDPIEVVEVFVGDRDLALARTGGVLFDDDLRAGSLREPLLEVPHRPALARHRLSLAVAVGWILLRLGRADEGFRRAHAHPSAHDLLR